MSNPGLSRLEMLALGLIALAGAALRAYQLEAADLWLDEANTALIVSQPIGPMLRELASEDMHPPLFYLLTMIPLALWPSEIGLRAVPWLFGVLCIPLAALVARDFGGRLAGIAAALLVAVSAPLVIFSQEGRMYTLLAFLQLLATWSLIRALQGGQRRWWAGFAVASALSLYTHNIAGLFLVAHLAAALWNRRQIRTALIATAAAVALYLPWLPFAVHQTVVAATAHVWRIDTLAPPLWMPLLTYLNLLAGSEGRHGMLYPRFAVEHLYLFGAAVALLVFGWQRLRPQPEARQVLSFAMLLPIGLALGLSHVAYIYHDKTFMVIALLLAVVAAAAVPSVSRQLRTLKSLGAPLVALGLLVFAQLLALQAHWAAPSDSYRTLVADLGERVEVGDAVQAVPWFLNRPLSYYGDRAGLELLVHEARPGLVSPAAAAAPPRLWVVSGSWDDWPISIAAADWRSEHGYERAWSALYPDEALRLTLYERPRSEGELAGR